MELLDYLVLIAYIAGVFIVGSVFVGKIKNSKDMFAAGGQSPWWLSGLSAFMTMFSAGTFVVWGGIAYKHGLVAISISLCYGVAAVAVGFTFADRWWKSGVTTAAEFIELRFGRKALQFFTWSNIVYKMVSVGVALYSLAILLCALVPMPVDSFFRDAATGNFSLVWAIIIFGGIVLIYTVIGGLWAVLMTDVLQFIVLSLAVVMVAVLLVGHESIGGFSGFIAKAPPGFLWPTYGEFSWFFLAGWATIHIIIISGDWAFAQRFLCVSSPKDARKSAWLFGIMYFISPFFWMMPPMYYRLINPNADPQEAYILACKEVLPPGIMGMMIAAMFSATASMVSAQLNVFSSVLTWDFYRGMFHRDADEKRLLLVGRITTAALGVLLIILAICVPMLGGAENIIITITSMIIGPLLLPTVWGLVSKRVDIKAVWYPVIICFPIGFITSLGLCNNGFLTGIDFFSGAADFVQHNNRFVEMVIGMVIPLIILSFLEIRGTDADKGWLRLSKSVEARKEEPSPVVSSLPGQIVAWNCLILGLLLGGVGLMQEKAFLIYVFAFLMTGIAAVLFILIALTKKKTKTTNDSDSIPHK